ncbi:MAG: hypothetical protein IKH01_06140 [Prevotella sp.]|nr:hypothetical protein [Prevotella sp.]
MATTNYSHAFLVGCFNGELNPIQLENDPQWGKAAKMPNKGEHGYDNLCTVYYKSHVDAMLEAEIQERPRFLQSVSHYIHKVQDSLQSVDIVYIKEYEDDEGKINKNTINLNNYKLKVLALHIYFFPLSTVLFAIEIDDSNSDINELTLGHFCLMNWIWEGSQYFDESTKSAFRTILQPFRDYLKDKTLSNLMNGGNKLKIFQTIQLESEAFTDETLYEIATNSPIGCVNGAMWLSPSKSYYDNIIKENSVSAFKSWKGLALMDSFTILGTPNGFREDLCNEVYFPLIYLRCFVEKNFCFSRNNNYREDKVKGNLSREIAQMEKYYFYKNISYNFLPNLLYEAMVKGLGIKEEREELSKQIKEKDEKNSSLLLGAVSVFAIFSVVYDFYSLIKAWSAKAVYDISDSILPIMNSTEQDSGELPIFAFTLSVLALITTITVIWYLKSQRRR